MVHTIQDPLVEIMEGGTGPGVHEEGRPPESRDGGEEQSLPATNYECIVSGLEKMSAHGESAACPISVLQHHNHSQQLMQVTCTYQPLQHLYRLPSHSYHSPCQIWKQSPYQLPIQPSFQSPHHPPQRSSYQPPLDPIRMYPPPSQPSHYPPHPPPFELVMGPPSYEHPHFYQASRILSQPPPIQSAYPPTCAYHPPHQPPHVYAPLHSPTGQPSYHPSSQPPPHPDTPLGNYALFLRDCYMLHKAPSTKWPCLDVQNYVNLAVISNVFADREELNKFREKTIHGSIDDILEWKAPIAMEDILKPDYIGHGGETEECLVTQLLIEGAPGIGKSTFAWEVCQKWSKNKLFHEYSLVVLLKFRDKRVQEARRISDLFYHPHPQLQSEIVNDIILARGDGLLLILEGFDEAPVSKRTVDSIFVRLFTGQELPKATVILTTRPSASTELRKLCRGSRSRRIEVVGFGKEEIDQYIRCAFLDEQSLSDFTQYLTLYPHIHALMYVPLNSAIVVEVFKSCSSSGTIVPKTMTQLYSSLIRDLLLRCLNDKNEYRDTCTSIHSFKDLPQPVYTQFHDICKLAYTGIMSAETELIFQDLPSDFDPLGLMQTCPELYVGYGASLSYNFVHLTIQEYLAAYYISQQSRDEQVAFMRKHIANRRLEEAVRFLAGFSLSELGQDLWDVVRGFACEDLPPLSELVRLNETKCVNLQVLCWLFESQYPLSITGVLYFNSVCFYHDCRSALQPFHWYVLGYCITHSSCYWKLELRSCTLESVKTFLKALSLQQDQLLLPPKGQIKQLVFWFSDPAALHLLVAKTPQMLVFRSLAFLSLLDSKLTSEICDHLCEHTDLLQQLLYLDLDSNPIGRRGAVNLITSITKFSTIRELYLRNTGIGFEDCKALSELLASSMLEVLHDGVSHSTSLEKLLVGHSNFSSENVLSLASVLGVNTRLKRLDIQHCNIQSSDSVYLAKALQENTSTQLQTLWMCGNPIGSAGAAAFAGMLVTNKSLVNLDMSTCSIGGEGALALSRMLRKNQCLKKIWFCDDSVGVEGCLNLIEGMKHSATAVKLVLSVECEPPSFSMLDAALKERIKFQYHFVNRHSLSTSWF